MTTQVRNTLPGAQLTNQGGVTLDGAEFLNRLAEAIRELQASPVFANGEGPILTSPNGTQYRLVVDNAGALTTSAV